jgi:VanZ family protein
MNIKVLFIVYWKSVLVTCVVLYLSLAPSGTFSKIPTFTHEDYLLHFLMYSGLTATLMYDARLYSNPTFKSSPHFFYYIFPVILGGLLEIFQPILSNRTASWVDFFFNSLGVLTTVIIFRYLRQLSTRK